MQKEETHGMRTSDDGCAEETTVKLRTLRALEGIEFYLSELLYYKGLEHPEDVYDEDERLNFTKDILERLGDYRRRSGRRQYADEKLS